MKITVTEVWLRQGYRSRSLCIEAKNEEDSMPGNKFEE